MRHGREGAGSVYGEADGANQRGAFLGATILIVTYVLAYCDRTVVTILTGPLKADLGFSDSHVALLIGFSFAIFYSVAGLPLGRVTDNANRRNLIVFAVVCWSAATAVSGLLNTFSGLFAARICVGIGEACLLPAALSMIADYFGPRLRAKAVTAFVCGAPLGSGVAYLLGGTVLYGLQHHPPGPPWSSWTRFSWQLIFPLLGALGVLMALLLLVVREPIRRQGVTRSNGEPPMSVWQLFFRRRRLLLCLIVGPGIMSIAFYSLFAWGPAMVIRKFGWGPDLIAFWFTPLVISSGLLGPWLGATVGLSLLRAGRTDGLPRAAVYLGSIAMVSCIGAMIVRAPSVAVTLLFLSTGLLTGVATLPTVAIQYIIPNHLRGQVTALFVFCSNIIGFGLGPTLVAVVTDHLFRDGARLDASLAVVCTTALMCGGTLMLAQLPDYRRYAADG